MAAEVQARIESRVSAVSAIIHGLDLDQTGGEGQRSAVQLVQWPCPGCLEWACCPSPVTSHQKTTWRHIRFSVATLVPFCREFRVATLHSQYGYWLTRGFFAIDRRPFRCLPTNLQPEFPGDTGCPHTLPRLPHRLRHNITTERQDKTREKTGNDISKHGQKHRSIHLDISPLGNKGGRKTTETQQACLALCRPVQWESIVSVPAPIASWQSLWPSIARYSLAPSTPSKPGSLFFFFSPTVSPNTPRSLFHRRVLDRRFPIHLTHYRSIPSHPYPSQPIQSSN